MWANLVPLGWVSTRNACGWVAYRGSSAACWVGLGIRQHGKRKDGRDTSFVLVIFGFAFGF